MEDPKIKAERLLAEVLPEDMYYSLAALGHCAYEREVSSSQWDMVNALAPLGSMKVGFKFQRQVKTEITLGKIVYSSCIHLSDGKAPDADRIVAEYFLIKNDPAKYFSTTNLTAIRQMEPLSGAAIRAMQARSDVGFLDVWRNAYARYLIDAIPRIYDQNWDNTVPGATRDQDR